MSKITKEEFLKGITKEFYNQGDSYYARLSDKGNWIFGYDNDYEMQHGKGREFMLPDAMVDILMIKCKLC